MSDISEIDKNLKVETNIEREGLRFYSVCSAPFRIYGVYHDGEKFRRLPKDVAESTSEGVRNLSVKTAGGRVRFTTDSPFVAIKAVLPHNTVFPHMTLAGVAGFDMYASENGNEKIVKIFVPPVNFEDSYEGLYDFPGGAKERVITVNFPLYNEVRELYVGVLEGCELKPAPDYKYEKPIVYYGSSITQGGCASRPGMCYTAILSRKYDIDHINLGFSGNGCGEPVMAEYIAGLDMQMFVYDYDYNSRSVEQYQETHEPFFKIIRRAHPDMPIIFMTKPKPECYMTEADYQKLEIAKRTYGNALASGDKNVYFIPGYELMTDAGTEGFVDMTHPTDLGFVSMANRLSVEFDKIFGKNEPELNKDNKMKSISEIDKNFKVESNIEREGLRFYNVRQEPFKIYGIYHDGEKFRRMPNDVAEKTNSGVQYLASNTAGGRVRFITDSPYVAIKAVLPHNVKFSHMPLTAIAGFDMYSVENGVQRVVKTFVPPVDFEDSYDGVYDFADGARERLITLNFPLYNDVFELFVGIKDGCELREAPNYKYEKPIVYYGSSITQGGCASRPGMSYQAIITRKYDINHINLGFSGSGRGEQIVADYISGLDMSVFVLDYDHNAPTREHYVNTHEKFFKTVRASHPDLPIIIMTRPKDELHLEDFEYARIEIAKRTYENAVANGDKNVYFIPGYELMAFDDNEGRVDFHHPTDHGFVSMAKRLSAELDKILG